jgi:hypothetical protein
MPDARAYFLTWTTYGTWVPGDERGWVEYRRGMQAPNPIKERAAAARMTDDARRLDQEQRRLVEATIADHCSIRGWTLDAVNCRSNHVNVVVAGTDREFSANFDRQASATNSVSFLGLSPTKANNTVSFFVSIARATARRIHHCRPWVSDVSHLKGCSLSVPCAARLWRASVLRL